MTATLYFSQKTGSGRQVILKQRCDPKDAESIREYNLLKYMWDSFGITPKELEDYNQDWIDNMIVVGNAESDAQEKDIEKENQKAKNRGNSSYARGGF